MCSWICNFLLNFKVGVLITNNVMPEGGYMAYDDLDVVRSLQSLCTAVSQWVSEAQETLLVWVSGVGGALDDDYPLTPRARAALLLGDR